MQTKLKNQNMKYKVQQQTHQSKQQAPPLSPMLALPLLMNAVSEKSRKK
jgi:hypothetical protein